MKINISVKLFFFALLVICLSRKSFCTEVLAREDLSKVKIHVTDSLTGHPIKDVHAITADESFFSNEKGEINLVLRGNNSVRTILLTCLGYETILLKHDISCSDQIEVRMKPVSQVLDEIVIRGSAPLKPANKVGEIVQAKTFEESVGTSLTAMLEKVNGVSSIRTGTTVSKPVIQGMSGHRILLINNGAKLAGQQWGADHAPEVDVNSYRDILVIKGSDAVQYGSDALGGIIIMNSAPMPYYGKVLSGKTTVSYGANGRKGLFTTALQGALPFQTNIAWRLQATYANSGDRSTPRYELNNTGTREYNLSAAVGCRLGKLTVEGSYNCYFDKTGVMFGAQMGSEDLLKERIELGRPVYTEPFSRKIRVPFQEVTHHTGILKADYDFGTGGKLEWQGTWQQNDREEYNNRRLDPSVPTVSLHLTSIQNKIRWSKVRGNWTYSVGGSIELLENHSLAGTGFVPIIPNYTETQAGGYGMFKYHKSKVSVEGGIRFDAQTTNAKGYDWTGSLYGGKRKFHNVTYSLGGHYHFNAYWKITSNFGVAWRAPHVFELYSNGNDLASGMFIKGDSLMNSETSYKWITSVKYSRNYFSLKIDGFLQWIDGYIYDEPTKETVTVISGAYPVFQYRQTPAFFRGVDLDMCVSPAEFLDYCLVTSYIAAEERQTGNYLPYIPPFRLRQEISFKKNWKKIKFSATLAHKYVAKQKRFNPNTDLITHTPPAYHLYDLHMQLGFGFKDGKNFKITASVENILNKEYKEYTNRSRYYAHDLGRDIRLSAIWTF